MCLNLNFFDEKPTDGIRCVFQVFINKLDKDIWWIVHSKSKNKICFENSSTDLKKTPAGSLLLEKNMFVLHCFPIRIWKRGVSSNRIGSNR